MARVGAVRVHTRLKYSRFSRAKLCFFCSHFCLDKDVRLTSDSYDPYNCCSQTIKLVVLGCDLRQVYCLRPFVVYEPVLSGRGKIKCVILSSLLRWRSWFKVSKMSDGMWQGSCPKSEGQTVSPDAAVGTQASPTAANITNDGSKAERYQSTISKVCTLASLCTWQHV